MLLLGSSGLLDKKGHKKGTILSVLVDAVSGVASLMSLASLALVSLLAPTAGSVDAVSPSVVASKLPFGHMFTKCITVEGHLP